MFVSETYTIHDYWRYNSLTDSSASSLFTKGSSATLSFSSNGMSYYASAGGAGNENLNNHIILNDELPDEFSIEITYNGGHRYSINLWADGMYIQRDGNSNIIWHEYKKTYTTWNSDDHIIPTYTEQATANVGDTFKIVKQNGTISTYHNDVLQLSTSVSDIPPHQIRFINCCSRSTVIKDLKIIKL